MFVVFVICLTELLTCGVIRSYHCFVRPSPRLYCLQNIAPGSSRPSMHQHVNKHKPFPGMRKQIDVSQVSQAGEFNDTVDLTGKGGIGQFT